MIVVDSSVWIGNLRGLDNRAVRTLRGLDDAGRAHILVGDLIMMEILQGARDEVHARRLSDYPREFAIAPMLGSVMAEHVAANSRVPRAHGLTFEKRST